MRLVAHKGKIAAFAAFEVVQDDCVHDDWKAGEDVGYSPTIRLLFACFYWRPNMQTHSGQKDEALRWARRASGIFGQTSRATNTMGARSSGNSSAQKNPRKFAGAIPGEIYTGNAVDRVWFRKAQHYPVDRVNRMWASVRASKNTPRASFSSTVLASTPWQASRAEI